MKLEQIKKQFPYVYKNRGETNKSLNEIPIESLKILEEHFNPKPVYCIKCKKEIKGSINKHEDITPLCKTCYEPLHRKMIEDAIENKEDWINIYAGLFGIR